MVVRSNLQEIRKIRGVSAADLAQQAGVSRQTIYSIEDGSFVPNTSVSLQLARALEVSVEQLFCMPEERPAAKAGTRKKLLLAGCDPALSLLSQCLRASNIQIVTAFSTSGRALEWLKQGKVDAAGSHLRDHATGDYNLPILRRLLPNAAVRVVNFAVWEEGLGVRYGNPKSIKSLADLARKDVTLINREKGAGSRDLLDTGLRKLGISSKNVKGYSSIAEGHLAAAYAVASGSADCCIAPRSAARCFGLDFIPLAVERFDISFAKKSLELPAAKAVLDLLNHSRLRRKLEAIAGYDAAHTGEVLL